MLIFYAEGEVKQKHGYIWANYPLGLNCDDLIMALALAVRPMYSPHIECVWYCGNCCGCSLKKVVFIKSIFS